MKNLILATVIFCGSTGIQAQSFEGVLTYLVQYEMKGDYEPLKEKIFARLKQQGEYFDTVKVYVKGGKYLKMANKYNRQTIIYVPETNQLVNLQENVDYVYLINAAQYNPQNTDFGQPQELPADSTLTVMGKTCKLLHLGWPKTGAQEYYFYNTSVATVNPKLFSKHNYEYLNLVLQKTGAFPTVIVKPVNNMVSMKMTMVNMEKKKLSDKIFQVPLLEEATDTYARAMQRNSSFKIMKRKP